MNSETKQMAERTTILRVPAGSTLHGLHVAESDDRDELGVCVEDLSYVIGFSEFDQFIFRTATERTGKHDEPSAPGDLDLTIYSLRKFLRLAMQGNPQILQALFVPKALCVEITPIGEELQSLAPYVVSRQAGKRFLGYLEAQRQRLLGERGQKRTNRPELEAKFGYDTKYLYHVVRLGFQGVELMTTGRLTVPLAETERLFCLDVRQGKISLQTALTTAGDMERQIKDLLHDAPIPDQPDRERIEQWMQETYWEVWKYRARPLGKALL